MYHLLIPDVFRLFIAQFFPLILYTTFLYLTCSDYSSQFFPLILHFLPPFSVPPFLEVRAYFIQLLTPNRFVIRRFDKIIRRAEFYHSPHVLSSTLVNMVHRAITKQLSLFLQYFYHIHNDPSPLPILSTVPKTDSSLALSTKYVSHKFR